MAELRRPTPRLLLYLPLGTLEQGSVGLTSPEIEAYLRQ